MHTLGAQTNRAITQEYFTLDFMAIPNVSKLTASVFSRIDNTKVLHRLMNALSKIKLLMNCIH